MTAHAKYAPAAAGARMVRVWDPFVRVFHWSFATLFLANALLIDDDGLLHQWVGYAVAGLVGLRILWGFVGPRPARFSSFPPSLGAARAHLAAFLGMARPSEPPPRSHNPLGALMVYNLLLTALALGLTGYMMTEGGYRDAEWLEEIHEALADWGLLSAGLHVAGVLIEQTRTGVPLIRAMITGDRPATGTGDSPV